MISEVKVNKESKITLREIHSKTVFSICKLKVNPEQNKFVTPVAFSISEAYFEPKAWFRAIYADEIPVGFLMLYVDREKPEYFLWRFLIDAKYQRMGFGNKAMKLIIEAVRTWPKGTELMVSYVPDENGPAGFYQNLGFKATGEIDEGEEVASLKL
ncbi:MAG: GNAT family N-acetyltransferase [Anaerolineae bacterium]|jgi:diamine N-acetyltransferase|nr:GNAT family N-acetyltransferase [Anaerolineae bacterium]MBT7075482.1 GNAT family N-acetyltransferase [Anaerolineae bacterium]MBT7781543.1 GNAT family N-acetyltransferase [Anaerolineae bacterium]